MTRAARILPLHLRPSPPAAPLPHEAGRPWSRRDAALWLGVSEKTVTRLVAAKLLTLVGLPATMRRILITDSSLRRLAESTVNGHGTESDR